MVDVARLRVLHVGSRSQQRCRRFGIGAGGNVHDREIGVSGMRQVLSTDGPHRSRLRRFGAVAELHDQRPAGEPLAGGARGRLELRATLAAIDGIDGLIVLGEATVEAGHGQVVDEQPAGGANRQLTARWSARREGQGARSREAGASQAVPERMCHATSNAAGRPLDSTSAARSGARSP